MSLHLSNSLRFGSVLFFAALSFVTANAQETVTGCMDIWACNFNDEATEDDGTCEYSSCLGCTNQYACNYDPTALYNDGSCEYLSCVGCMVELACNFDPLALFPSTAACDFESCVGCTDFTACTYDPDATLTDLNECEYPEPGLDCAGNTTNCGGCEPVFLTELPFTSVNCIDELPLIPDDAIVAINGCTGDTLDVHSYVVDVTDDFTNNVGVTADGMGPDGAIRVFGLTALGLANSDYFAETFPLLVTRYANGTAVVNGQVHNVLNPNLKWNVHLVLEDATLGDEWLGQNPEAGFVTAFGCSVDTSEVMVYRLSPDHSYLNGAGGYEGSYLHLSHMPFDESKRFQLGEGGNSVNCNYGLGGWFAWEGRVLGEEVNGMSGDLVIDLDEDVTNEVACGSEAVVHFHHALNAECGLFTESIQIFSRSDQEAPQWNNTNCADAVSLCFDFATQTTAIPTPCAFAFEDECGEPVQTDFTESVLDGDPDLANDQPFTIQRAYTGVDCSGNSTTFVQTLVFDGSACPVAPASPLESTWSEPNLKQPKIANSTQPMVSGLYPNPTVESSTLEINFQSENFVKIIVFDLTGEIALPPQIISGLPGDILNCSLDGSTLRPGCYLVQIQGENQRTTLRWTVGR